MADPHQLFCWQQKSWWGSAASAADFPAMVAGKSAADQVPCMQTIWSAGQMVCMQGTCKVPCMQTI
eukprot:NODE_1336_length_1465_cov_6.480226_g1108_i0.p8 GENE.NODE_1336_length_1465_cov_6.480226_g1108_i0~~NODE_1336_length_1465_cov_6.480226_g1108_i0.p8  ORF type:complete len:66 (+),score=7.30 NODE_1336_length_1465_cov_6.480226_g1108_i0:950-1147(+)